MIQKNLTWKIVFVEAREPLFVERIGNEVRSGFDSKEFIQFVVRISRLMGGYDCYLKKKLCRMTKS